MVVKVTVEGLDSLERDIAQYPVASAKAAQIAVNATARLARTLGTKGIQAQVALNTRYIQANLTVIPAKLGAPTAIVRGRFRPTSLARYATNRAAPHGSPARLRVKRRGAAVLKRRLFLFKRLSTGSAVGQDGRRLPGQNIGLAIRLKKGEQLRNRKKAIRFSDDDGGLYLLYSPSIDQVFKDVRNDLTPKITPFLEREYGRQLTRLLR